MISESKFRKAVKPHILRCRSGDWQHALRVVRWVNKLGADRKDLPILVVAGYIHDIGWRDVLPRKKITFDELLKFEKQANRNSKPFITELLKGLSFSKKEIDTINRLVKAADDHRAKRADEAILTDSDQMSKLALGHLQQKYKKSEWLRMCNVWRDYFPGRITTTEAKKIWEKELDKLERAVLKSQ